MHDNSGYNDTGFWGFAVKPCLESEKRTLSALRALFDTGAPLAPLRQRRSNLL